MGYVEDPTRERQRLALADRMVMPLVALMRKEHGLAIAPPDALAFNPSRTPTACDDGIGGYFVPIGAAGRIRVNVEVDADEIQVACLVAHELWHAAMYQNNPRYKDLYRAPGELYDTLDEGVAVHGEVSIMRCLARDTSDPRYGRCALTTENWARYTRKRDERTYRHGWRAVRFLFKGGWDLKDIVENQGCALERVAARLKNAGLGERESRDAKK